MTRDGRPRQSDLAVLDAVHAALDAGDRDCLRGGVTPEQAADHCDLSPERLQDRFRELRDEGELVTVWGASPGTGRPRESYLPTGHPDV
ncbi:hypothetical protein [Haloarcula amylovorans]|uniref:hypothetical protein n=1 Tax=Haloarcula amylovorans TaxID=2562280 RepID=UPI0010767760|nr:hypothetical protein [Halomicroarcula amylolytica]